MIRFGPAGASDSFREQGLKHTRQAPEWLAARGLNAFEYSAGHGVRLSPDTAGEIGRESMAHGIAVSIHAPYFINLAQQDNEKLENSMRYLRESADAVRAMGGSRVVFHAGTLGGADRGEAFSRVMSAMEQALAELPQDITFCPETMGRRGQIGSVDEVTQLCLLAENMLPAIDFAHIHALSRLETQDDFRRVLDPMLDALGYERMRHFHAHFSHIEYTDAGEKRHRNFDEEGFGPDFRPLARVLRAYQLEPVIICESRGHQAEDATTMKKIYEEESGCFIN